MIDTPHTWQVVASRKDVLEAGLSDVAIGRRVILLVGRGEEVLAFQGLCPHQHALLAEGTLDGDELQCPRHLARFNLDDGACGGGWQLPALRRYEARIDGDDVLLTDPPISLD